MRSGCTALVALLLAAGCYAPDPPEGLPCSMSRSCPEGQTCTAEGLCYRVQPDGAPVGGDGGCADADRRAQPAGRLVASDPSDGANLGEALALEGSWLAIGVDSDDGAGEDAGAVYLFERTGEGWTERQKLLASDGAPQHRFGAAVAMDEGTLVVGAPGAGDPASGRAYVFTLDGGSWGEQQILGGGGAAGDEFGTAVAVRGDHLAVGAPGAGGDTGAAFAYDRGDPAWTPAGEFIPGDAASAFGAAIAIDATTLAVGTPEDDDDGLFSGSVFLLSRSGASWVSSGKLTASDASGNDTFGSSLALDGGRLLVGAPFRGDTGAAYLYDGEGFAREQILVAGDGAAGDGFGRAVAIRGGLVAVGAPSDDDGGTSTGSIYLFAAVADDWSETDKVIDEEAAAFDILGSQVALEDGVLVAGAPLRDGDPAPPNAGAALVFALQCP